MQKGEVGRGESCVGGGGEGEAGTSLRRRRHYASLPRALAQGTGTQRARTGRIVGVALLRQRNTMREITHTSNARRSRVAVCRKTFFNCARRFTADENSVAET